MTNWALAFASWAVASMSWAVVLTNWTLEFASWPVTFESWSVVFTNWAFEFASWAVAFISWVFEFASWAVAFKSWVVVLTNWVFESASCVVAFISWAVAFISRAIALVSWGIVTTDWLFALPCWAPSGSLCIETDSLSSTSSWATFFPLGDLVDGPTWGDATTGLPASLAVVVAFFAITAAVVNFLLVKTELTGITCWATGTDIFPTEGDTNWWAGGTEGTIEWEAGWILGLFVKGRTVRLVTGAWELAWRGDISSSSNCSSPRWCFTSDDMAWLGSFFPVSCSVK